VRGKIVDYISHSIDDGTLCMNVCFKEQNHLLAPLRLRDISSLGPTSAIGRPGTNDIIRGVHEADSGVAGELTSDALRSCRHCLRVARRERLDFLGCCAYRGSSLGTARRHFFSMAYEMRASALLR